MKATIENNTLTIVIQLNPKPSATGKSTVLASTHGNQPTTLQYEGRPVIIGLNAYAKVA